MSGELPRKILKGLGIAVVAWFLLGLLVVTIMAGWGAARRGELDRAKAQADAQALAAQIELGKTRSVWLEKLKPLEVGGQCTYTQIRNDAGGLKNCIAEVGPLFDACSSNTEFVIPEVIPSREEAQRYAELIGLCIKARHFGGEQVERFQAAIQPQDRPG